MKAEDLLQFAGVGDAKATLILAAIEFARRRIKPEGAKIETPADLLPHVRHYADRKQEHLLCASINGANEILNIRVVSIGLIDRTPVHPSEVFADALSDRAAAVIVAHNHPSGSLEPSPADVAVTNQLKAAGHVLGITLLDHIIFNRNSYYSFLEADRLTGCRRTVCVLEHERRVTRLLGIGVWDKLRGGRQTTETVGTLNNELRIESCCHKIVSGGSAAKITGWIRLVSLDSPQEY